MPVISPQIVTLNDKIYNKKTHLSLIINYFDNLVADFDNFEENYKVQKSLSLAGLLAQTSHLNNTPCWGR